jgi:outer membrane protein assembly factor BamB
VAPTSAPEPASTCAEGELPAAGALDLATGDVRWTVCSAAEVYRTLVGAFDDVVVVSETAYPDAEVVALSLTDGAERWRRPTTGQPIETPRGPTAGVGIVLRILSDGLGAGGLAGLDVATGEVVWQLAEPLVVLGQSDTTAVVASFDPATGSPPVIEGIDLATGAEVWTSQLVFADLSGVGVSRGPAAVWDGTIAVPTGESLTAVDIDSGAVRWVGPQTDHPEAADGVVVGTADSGRTIRALDAFSGELLWEAPGRPSYGDLLAIGDGIVVVNALDRPALVAYNVRTGSERWRIDAAGIGEPQVVAGSSVVTLWERRLSAVSTSNGVVQWSADAPFGSPWMSSVAVDATTVYVSVNSRPWGD